MPPETIAAILGAAAGAARRLRRARQPRLEVRPGGRARGAAAASAIGGDRQHGRLDRARVGPARPRRARRRGLRAAGPRPFSTEAGDDAPRLVVTHNPGLFLDMPEGCVMVAGHMHGGQIRFPGLPALVVPTGRAPRRWANGHFRERGGQLVVSAGLGVSGLPWRFGHRAGDRAADAGRSVRPNVTIRPHCPKPSRTPDRTCAMFSSVLIANRGEIACRVIRTAKRHRAAHDRRAFGGRRRRALRRHGRRGPPDRPRRRRPRATCASTASSKSPSARARSASIPATASSPSAPSSPTPAPRRAIVFVGPPASAIRAMGLKDAAKALAQKAGVPVVPGYHGAKQEPEFLRQKAYEVGYPVLIKAVAGGGGKGMRRVDRVADFEVALAGGPARGASAASAIRGCWWRSTCSRRGTSRCRCSATGTATSCTCSSATARSSAGTRR